MSLGNPPEADEEAQGGPGLHSYKYLLLFSFLTLPGFEPLMGMVATRGVQWPGVPWSLGFEGWLKGLRRIQTLPVAF